MDLPDTRYALQARYVIPVEQPPLAGGCVVVDRGRIREVTTSPPRGCPLIDLGSVALLPGLVNAHAHLDFSDCKVPLGRPGMPFAEWLDLAIERRRSELAPDQVDHSSRTIAKGIEECRRCGTTTLADIVRDEAAALQEHAGLDRLLLLELIGLAADRAHGQRIRLGHWLTCAEAAVDRDRFGVSPHAPYSTRREIVHAAVEASQRTGMLVAMHLAESLQEMEFLEHQTGPLVDLLVRWNAWDASAFEPGLRPRHYLEMLAQAPRALVIHGNYLDAADHAFLAAHADRMALVYCPRTHSYFGHSPYPLAQLLSAGVKVALGTDGRGTNPDLSLLAEMQHVARAHPDVSPEAIVRMATLGGAAALGCAGRVGSLVPGKEANLVAIGLPEQADGDPYALLLDSQADVIMTIRHGRMVYAQPSADAT